MKFESGVGFSNGCDGVGIDVTAAICPEHLDRDLRRHRSLHDVLLGDGLLFHHRLAFSVQRFAILVHFLDRDFHRLDQRRFRVRLEVLDHALRHEEKREDDADRDEQVIGDADEIDPEVADGVGGMARNCPNERCGNSDAGRGADEIVKCQPHHLREVRHGGFADVALPVGVGGETCRSVERTDPGSLAARPCGFSGRIFCSRRIA